MEVQGRTKVVVGVRLKDHGARQSEYIPLRSTPLLLGNHSAGTAYLCLEGVVDRDPRPPMTRRVLEPHKLGHQVHGLRRVLDHLQQPCKTRW